MRLPALLVLLPLCLQAQEILDRDKGERVFNSLSSSTKNTLRASFYVMHPRLGLSFRFQTGYVIEVPMEQFEGSNHLWAITARVTPRGRDPVYIGSLYHLATVPKGYRQNGTIGGMFFVGEGEYHIDLYLGDEQGRTAHKSYTIGARRSGAERKVSMVMEPLSVGSLGTIRWARMAEPGQEGLRLSFLIHAAPSFWRSNVLRPRDIGRLLSQMSAILEQFPVKSLRVVAFNLDQHAEIFREASFRPDSMEKLRTAMEPVELGKVDVKVLANPRGHIDLLADLVNEELTAAQPADAVIFLGPRARTIDKVNSDEIESRSSSAPRFFYFQSNPFVNPLDTASRGQLPDTIEWAVRRAGGKTFHIFTPGDFAKGIEALKKQRPIS